MALKTLLPAGFLSFALALPADAVLPSEYSVLAGYGVRFSLGYAFASTKFKRHYSHTTPSLAFSDHINLSPRSMTGGLDIHYGKFTKNGVYVGGEVFYNYAGANDSTVNKRIPGLSNRIHINYGSNIGVAFKAGGLLFGALHYVKVGGAFTEIKATSSIPNIHQGRTDRFRGGWLVGIGAESPVSKLVSLGGEFIHSEYANACISQTISSSVSSTAKVHYRIKPKLNLLVLTAKVKIG